MKKHPLIQQLDRLATERWARRGMRTLLQAASLAVGVWCIGLGAALVWGWQLDLRLLSALALAILALSLAGLLRPRMRTVEVARRLDRRFHLNEQLATAVEIAGAPAQYGTVGERLLDQSARSLGVVRSHIRGAQRSSWGDLLILLALLAVAVGLLLLSSISGLGLTAGGLALPPPNTAANPLDRFPQESMPPGASDGLAGAPGEGDALLPGADGSEGGQQPGSGQQQPSGQPQGSSAASGAAADPQTLEAIADALRDQGVTRPVAEALDQGDTATAAQELRELADQAGALSPQARESIAEALREAADQVDQRNQDMASQLRESARGLERDSAQSNAEALDDLASELERLGEQAGGTGQQGQNAPGQEGQGAEQSGQADGQAGAQGQQPGSGSPSNQGSSAGNAPGGEQRPISPAGRLGVEGQPVELQSQGGGQPGSGNANPATSLPGGTGSTTGGQSGAGGAIGADPLRIPLDERDVVQEYFRP